MIFTNDMLFFSKIPVLLLIFSWLDTACISGSSSEETVSGESSSIVQDIRQVEAFRKPFEDCSLQGSITIYDYQKQQWLSSDTADSYVATLPASTFKIMNTLIALETGVVADEEEVIPWIGAAYDTARYSHRPDIYHSMSMREAFKLSAGWAYVELAKRVGKELYAKILAEASYGNGDFSVEGADFWNFGSFAVSPVEQVQALIGVYDETLPFSQNSFTTLKDMMIEEQTDNYILRAKTGWTRPEAHDIGWWVGYVEKGEEVYFFATRVIKERATDNPDFGKCRKDITKAVLRQVVAI
jgi:beta-lactamase class D